MWVYIFFVGGICLFFAYYLFGRFSYELHDQVLVVRRKILYFIPYGFRRIPISSIREIRRFGGWKDVLRGADMFGNLFLREGVIIILKDGIFRRIFITPEKPDEFIKRVETQQSLI